MKHFGCTVAAHGLHRCSHVIHGRMTPRSFSVVRMPSALIMGSLSALKVLLLMAVALCMDVSASAQSCPPPPEDPGCWSECGDCRGDLNEDGLLDQLDLLVFVLFRDQQPQNPCANFNGDCTPDGDPLVDDKLGVCSDPPPYRVEWHHRLQRGSQRAW